MALLAECTASTAPVSSRSQTMTSLLQDVRYGFRMLLKHKGFTTVATLTLALGIGVNTAMFSVLNTFLFRSLPYPQSSQLVRVFRTSPISQNWPHNPGVFLTEREKNTVFERSEEHTSELQSPDHLVCRLLLEK